MIFDLPGLTVFHNTALNVHCFGLAPPNTCQDVELFQAILCEQFPEETVQQQDRKSSTLEQLRGRLEAACCSLGLQPVPSLVDKACQLHDTLGQRLGVALIGPAGVCCCT
jgi:Hydrolytic ATP binding site of dynein motor region